jgi:hypothetical protein
MNLFWRSEDAKVEKKASVLPRLNLLVIAADRQACDWSKEMEGSSVADREIKVTQVSWKDIEVSAEPKASYRPSTIMVRLTSQAGPSLRPDLVLIRNEGVFKHM